MIGNNSAFIHNKFDGIYAIKYSNTKQIALTKILSQEIVTFALKQIGWDNDAIYIRGNSN